MEFSVIAIFLVVFFTSIILLIIYFGHKIYLINNQAKLTAIQLQNEEQQNQKLGTELSELKEKFAHDVLYDSITGLPGRQVLEDRLSQTINQSNRYDLTFAVMFLDLDGFKVINDALGHDVGDELLKETGMRLRNSIRHVDSVSRFGGDEFVIILSQLSKPETAAYVAQRLIEAISQPYKLQGQDVFMTASIGIATFPADGNSTKALLKCANSAVHQAKTKGRNTYQFYRPEMHALSQRELTLSTGLQNPMIFRDFIILYQPQINVETRKIASMQALLYWQHPDYGLLELNEFLRMAENNSKIIEIGSWVLQNAFQQFIKWKSSDIQLNAISVAVSLRQLENPRFAFQLSQMLQEMQIDPGSLILEIAEPVLLTRLDMLEKMLHMLKHVGVQILIREFGKGHLSLQHLQRFPIDYLKIANSVIRDVTVNKESESIVKMICALGNSLQIFIAAECIDTPKQKALLSELGCKIMQGELFCKPMAAEELTQEKLRSLILG